MNSSNTDPFPKQPAIVAPFVSPVALHLAQAAPSFPLPLASAAPQSYDNIPSPPSPEQESDPDWSVSPPKRPPYRERLPTNLTILAVAIHFGLDQSSFNGSHYRCPFHSDNHHPNLSFKNPKSRDGRFRCFACSKSGDMIDWVGCKLGVNHQNAYDEIRRSFGLPTDEMLVSDQLRQLPGKVRLYKARPFDSAGLKLFAAQRPGWLLEAFEHLQQNARTLCFVPKYRNHPAYALLDPFGRSAVLRRLDAQSWPGGQKAANAPGTNPGVPIGIHLTKGFDKLLFVEGGPDYLRIASLLFTNRLTTEILPVMMINSGVTIHEALLPALEARRVRIIAQNDPPGLDAAMRWTRQLESVGSRVDIWRTPQIPLSLGGYSKDIDEICSHFDPNAVSRIVQLKDIFNFDVTLFHQAPECLSQSRNDSP